MSNAEPTNDELSALLQEIHHKVTHDQDLYVSIVYYSQPGPSDDERPQEIQISRHMLPRVGEYIRWNDHPFNRSRVIEVSHEFPTHTSHSAHSVTLVVEDVPGT